ncbi:hypothetical protein T01_10291 [Trichinella spiralis]|uniref:Uncharacterized protein n=1 Tax=Trichinella spiralis TaxID=6334 RepID=A0A0V1BKM1_TRISP|nr:hypothetical protein T01_10291 [Trichinella spiralis]
MTKRALATFGKAYGLVSEGVVSQMGTRTDCRLMRAIGFACEAWRFVKIFLSNQLLWTLVSGRLRALLIFLV